MKKRDGFDPLSLVSKIADKEKQLIGSKFLAPKIGTGKIRLKLSGIAYQVDAPDSPDGWGIFELKENSRATYLEAAPLNMVRNYLLLLTQVRLVILDKFENDNWWAIVADQQGQKLQINGPVPVHLITRTAPFETVYSRFDGAQFWFESTDRKRDPMVANELRKSLEKNTDPAELQCKGAVPQERLAYKILHMRKNKERETPEPQDNRSRISRALAHSGAELDSFWQERDSSVTTVRFRMGDQVRAVSVNTDNLSVISSGICLSGRDSDFDLSSLVGVLKEAEEDYDYY